MAVVRVKEMDECRFAQPWWLRRQVGRVRNGALPKAESAFREEEIFEDAAGADQREEITRVEQFQHLDRNECGWHIKQSIMECAPFSQLSGERTSTTISTGPSINFSIDARRCLVPFQDGAAVDEDGLVPGFPAGPTLPRLSECVLRAVFCFFRGGIT